MTVEFGLYVDMFKKRSFHILNLSHVPERVPDFSDVLGGEKNSENECRQHVDSNSWKNTNATAKSKSQVHDSYTETHRELTSLFTFLFQND